jgi:uncharacterized membrane protein YphA (DoxX/SURF4 family)
MHGVEQLVARARANRGLAVAIANLRILVGFAFVPAGLKKVLGEPFTDPNNTGPFHDFLHAFLATGWFYNAVGVIQLVAATLLVTQRFAFLGALLVLPVITAITAFCWSTMVVPTAIVATLMLLGTLALVAWDLHRWLPLFGKPPERAVEPPIDQRLWQWCGIAVLALYLGYCAATGEVYRPRGAKPDEPGFYLFPVIVLLPIVTFVIEQRRRR